MAAGGVLALAGLFVWYRDPSRPRHLVGSAGRHRTATLFLLVGLIAMSASMYTPWWVSVNSVQLPEYTNGTITSYYVIHGHIAFLPGDHFESGCTVDPPTEPNWGPICNLTAQEGGSIPDLYAVGVVPYRRTGQVYGEVQILLGSALLTGGVAAILGFPEADGSKAKRRARIAAGLLVAAFVLATGSLAWAVVAQPGALAADHAPSPAMSFWGSCSGPNDGSCVSANDTNAWGAGPGWYLCALATVSLAWSLVFVAPRWARESKDGPEEETV